MDTPQTGNEDQNMPEQNNHGGARPGAGRKPRAIRYAEQIAAGEAALIGLLPKAVSVLRSQLEKGDMSAAKMIFTFCLGRPAPQELPLSEDYRLASDHPAADEVGRLRRQHALSKELTEEKENSATTGGSRLGLERTKKRIFLSQLEDFVEKQGCSGIVEAYRNSFKLEDSIKGNPQGQEVKKAEPLPSNVVQLLPRFEELTKKKNLTPKEKKELTQLANKIAPYLEAAE